MKHDPNPGDLSRLLTPEPEPIGWQAANARAFVLFWESRTGLRLGDELSALAWYVWQYKHGAKFPRIAMLGIGHALRFARARGQLQQLNLKIDALEHHSSRSWNLRERILTAYRHQIWKLKRLPYVHEIEGEMKTRFPQNRVPNPKTIWDQLHKDSLPRNPRGWPKGKKR